MSQRKYLVSVFAVLLFVFASRQSTAQIDVRTIDMNQVNKDKSDGKLNGTEHYINYQSQPLPQFSSTPTAANRNSSGNSGNQQTSSLTCDCWATRDASWQIAQFDGSGGSGGPGVAPDYRNDDWSTDTIFLPFQFCLYGRQSDTAFINNNGNVSFGEAYSTYSPTGFPAAGYPMVAPFWADVDTRGAASGLVYYTITPTHMIVQWENVGYFGSHTDKLNSFQLIITNGSDPILSAGTNVSFCYKNMEWTTGDASGGVNGYGGFPASVGINKGDGIAYIQYGRFDTAGTVFNPPPDTSGIGALANQSFALDGCNIGTNIPPLAFSPTPLCDTFKICVGDTAQVTMLFLSPESGQITTPTVSGLMTGLSTVLAIPGNTATIIAQLIGLPSNVGMNVIDIRGTDNGGPFTVYYQAPGDSGSSGPNSQLYLFTCKSGHCRNSNIFHEH